MARDIGAQMMLAEWLFVETIADLRRRCEDPTSRTRYELLGIAPLLRKLLLDGAPLLTTVRTVRPQVPVEYRIQPWEDDGRFAREGLRATLSLGGATLLGTPDTPRVTDVQEFRDTIVGRAEGVALTVRSVIRYYAHVEGGVHFGSPKDPGEDTLNGMAPVLLGNTTGQIEILAHLGQIVVDALSPLQDDILGHPSIVPAMHQRNAAGYYELHWTATYWEQQATDHG